MFQAYLPMVEFYKKYLENLKEQGFLWCMFLLSRNAETEDIFVDVVRHWTSLNDITGKNIAFVFSCDERMKRAAVIRLYESRGVVNPFISKVPMGETEWCWDSMETDFDVRYVERMPNESLAELHSQSITDMVEFLGISEADVPSLVLTNLMTKKHYLLPISNHTEIYKVVKRITVGLENITDQWKYLKKIDDENKGASSRFLVYQNTKEKLEKRISLVDEKTKAILFDILNGADYVKYKKEACFQKDKVLRDEVKKFINQRRHFYIPYKDNGQIVSTALEMAVFAEKEDEQIRKIVENLRSSNLSTDGRASVINQFELLEFVEDNLISACLMLQKNMVYKNLKEDERTNFIYDILGTAGRDKEIHVEGQARQGRSESGKQSGEADILVKYKGNPVSIVEAMNLNGVIKKRISSHIEKLFGYDAAGNPVNYLISYVGVKNFEKFWIKYKEYIKSYNYKYQLTTVEENVKQDFCYSDIRLLTATHRRYGVEVSVVHIAVKMME